MLINITASACFFIVLLILMIDFFSKKTLDNLDNNSFKHLSIISLFGLAIEFIDYLFVILGFNIYSSFILFLGRLIFGYYVIFMYYFILYVYITCKKIQTQTQEFKTFKKVLSIIYIILFVLVCVLPFNFAESTKYLYPVGLATDFSYMIGALAVLFIFVFCILNIKNLKQQKSMPIIWSIIGAITSLAIQFSFHELLLLIPSHAIAIIIMYFTMENPDIKMLEEVHRAKEITDSANEEKAMFLYNMTNEIRNITKDIDDSAENILSETDNKNINVENINDNARDIKVSTAKFTSMTNEILDISSIDSANIKIYNDKYNIKLILKELVQIYKNSAEKKGLQFRTNIASDLPEYLYGDAVNVKVSLNTILDNAVKYTERGFIEFNVNAIMKNDIARLIISVEDSGVGMKAEDLNKIFNKREEDKENTNLKSNLYNAKKLVTLMGGTIIPSSIYGKGTIIKVVLDQKIGEIETELNKYESVYDKKKILIVDDNPSSIKMITKLLKDSNLIIDIASSGKECLDKIRDKEKYDLILLDENMTPLNGLTVMQKLREIRNFNINVILLTKNNDYEYNEDYLKYGFKDYLIKPIDKDKLLKKISKYSK